MKFIGGTTLTFVDLLVFESLTEIENAKSLAGHWSALLSNTHFQIRNIRTIKIVQIISLRCSFLSLWTLSAMMSKHKNGSYGVGTFVQKIVKTELIR